MSWPGHDYDHESWHDEDGNCLEDPCPWCLYNDDDDDPYGDAEDIR